MRFRAFALLSLLIASGLTWLGWHSARGLVASAQRPVQRVRLQALQEEAAPAPAPAAPETTPEEAPPPPAPEAPPPRPTAREELEAARERLAEEDAARGELPPIEPRPDLLREREEIPEAAQRGAPVVSEPPGLQPGGEGGAGGEAGAAPEAAQGAAGEPPAEEAGEPAGEGAPEEGAEEGGEAPAEGEEARVDERLDDLQRQLDELKSDQEASQQEIAALQQAIEEREEELRFLEENRRSRIQRLDESIVGINEVEPLLASGSLDVDGDLARIAGILDSASLDAASYAGEDEARLSGLAADAVLAARDALARDDIFAARVSLGVALSQARAARVAAEGQ